MLRHALAFLLALLSVPSAARGQAPFGAWLENNQVVPPTGAGQEGRAYFSLDTSSGRFYYRIDHEVSAPIGAQLRQGAPGTNGSLVRVLTIAGPGEISGETTPLSDAEQLSLWRGEFYVVIQSHLHPDGAIRGQISRSYERRFEAALDGASAVPPSTSTATGTARLELRMPERVLTVDITTAGLSTSVLGASLRQGTPNSNGPILIDLGTGTLGSWTKTYKRRLNNSEISLLELGDLYVEVRTVAFPSGAIRGAVKPLEETYFVRLQGGAGVPPGPPAFSGLGVITYNLSGNTLSVEASWDSGLAFLALGVGFPGEPLQSAFQIPVPPGTSWSASLPANGFLDDLRLGRLRLCAYIANPLLPLASGNTVQNPLRYGFSAPTGAPPLGRLVRISSIGRPALGERVDVIATDAVPLQAASLAYCEDTAGTPLELAFAGLVGHYLWGNALAAYSTVTNAEGRASISFDVPNTASLIGETFFLQWFTLDPGASPLGVATSDALKIFLTE
ncbi:MAG: CHRD domain-containing protein [Planctomycetes bacterium]|nr:CHRD domain-containing protein [Planctomycetota bacterium]